MYDREDKLLDSVTFGPQIPDLSVGRLSVQGDWTLTVPTFGQANRAAILGDPKTVKINEWLAHGDLLYQNDWVELYNPQPWPVEVSGMTLTDTAHAPRPSQQLSSLSFIAAEGTSVWIADNRTKPGHLDMKLSAQGESLVLLNGAEQVIDAIHFGPQTTDASQGRTPDGADVLAFFDPPTPGSPNPGERFESVSSTVVALDAVWAYQESQPEDLWLQPGYDDSTWSLGPALLYVESSTLPGPKSTPLTLGRTTYYFRTHFNLDDPTVVTELSLTTVIDDGALVYLNGHEILRLRLPEGVIDDSTLTSSTVGNAVLEGPFVVPAEFLLPGDNVLAVEVHQASLGSSDIVFGLSLDALVTQPVTP